jgi:hypothetical protein
MNRKLLWIVLAVFALPILVHLVWFFPGFNLPRTIATPDYGHLKMPEAPVSTPQTEEIKQKGGVVLVDYSHSNSFQPNEIQMLVNALGERGARLELNSDSTKLEAQLKYAGAYVVISPAYNFTSDEIRLVQDFVGYGGRLAVFTDATRGTISYDFFGSPTSSMPDVNTANPLLEPFGITVNADYLYNLVDNEGNFRNVYFENFGKSDLTWGLKKVALYGVHSMETDSGLPLLTGSDKTFSSQTDAIPGNDPKMGWAAAILSEDGNVLAVGDFTFLMPPYNTVADNGTFINNIADFLVSGARKVALSDYPYIFKSKDVHVLPTSNVQLTAEMTGALSRLQSDLKTVNNELTVIREAPSEGDLIVLGTFSPGDDLAKYVEPFNLTLDDLSQFIEVPHFGKIGRSGNGILLFSPSSRGNTLVLLADTVDDLTTLMDTLSSGNLSGCVLQGDLGVCSIGFGGSFSESTPFPELKPGEATPTPPG